MGLFRMLFSKYKCSVYTAFGYEQYFKVINNLQKNGVSYQTVTIRNPTINNFARNHDLTQYEIYVKEEDKHKAQQAIHS